MKTEAPWYWTSAECDHCAVGLVACAEETGLIHYALKGKRQAACGHVEGLKLLHGPQVVTCHACCIVAREGTDLIDQREVRPVITHAQVWAFKDREARRKRG